MTEPDFEILDEDESLDYGFEIKIYDGLYFLVVLPHQCDDWVIAGEPYCGGPKAQAVAELKEFIRQAQACLAELEAHE